MEAIEEQIVLFLENVMQTIGWNGVVVAMAIESANIPLPSEVTMPLAGWMLSEAVGQSAWHAILAGGFFGALGCTIGSVGSYALGAYGGRPFLDRYGRYLLLHAEDLARADQWFARWGDWAVFVSRLLPVVRTFISFPAGVARTRFSTFTILTFVGSFIWCGALAWAGYEFGARWREVRAIMRPFDIPILLIGLAGLAYFVYRHLGRAPSRTPAAEDATD